MKEIESPSDIRFLEKAFLWSRSDLCRQRRVSTRLGVAAYSSVAQRRLLFSLNEGSRRCATKKGLLESTEGLKPLANGGGRSATALAPKDAVAILRQPAATCD